MTDHEAYRVVLHGTGDRSGTIASSPGPAAEMRAGYERVSETFASDVEAGNMRIELVTAAEYERRQR